MENLAENNNNELKEETGISNELTQESDIIYCPNCKQANKKSQKTLFCTHCGHRFLEYRKNIPKVYTMKKKKKRWRLLTGFTISLGTYILTVIASFLILVGISISTNIETDSMLFTFLITFSSLLFFIIPVLWIKRYYPGTLSMKQRLSELGISLEKYSRKELIREILLGFLLGLLAVFLAILLQLISFYLIKLIYRVDIYNFMEATNFEGFAITIPNNIFEVILLILMMSFLVGLPEEIMFRGFVQRSFENSLTKPAALLLTAVYFTFFHVFLLLLNPIVFFFSIIPFIGLSILLGLIRNWRGDIIAAIFTHFVYNSTQIIIIYLIFYSI